MENLPVDSIALESYTHSDVDDNYTLSSKTGPNKSVVITPSDRKHVYLNF